VAQLKSYFVKMDKKRVFMSDEEFLKIRKTFWEEARFALNIKYNSSDEYFVKYFGTRDFDKNYFRKLKQQENCS
jgi:hypothetical protein